VITSDVADEVSQPAANEPENRKTYPWKMLEEGKKICSSMRS